MDQTSSCSECERLRQQLADKEIEVAALRAHIDELGRHDPMTGVLNRRTLMETLEAELQRAQRTGHPFCFAVLDLDQFRNVNAQYGHPAGDAVLRQVADTAVALLRTVDRFGRLDGEAFGIVLPATWLDQGLIAMRRLRHAVGECDWSNVAAGLSLRFSAGITTNAFGDTPESMIRRAEKALEQAKQAGGDCTMQAEEALPDAPPIDLSE